MKLIPKPDFELTIGKAFHKYALGDQSWKKLVSELLPFKPGESSALLNLIKGKELGTKKHLLLFMTEVLHEAFLLDKAVKRADLLRMFKTLKADLAEPDMADILEAIFFDDQLRRQFRISIAAFLLEVQKAMFDMLKDRIYEKIPFESIAYLKLLENRISEKGGIYEDVRDMNIFVVSYFLRCHAFREYRILEDLIVYLDTSQLCESEIKDSLKDNLGTPKKGLKHLESVRRASLKAAFEKVIGATDNADAIQNLMDLSIDCSESMRGAVVIASIKRIDSSDDKDKVCKGIINILAGTRWEKNTIKKLANEIIGNIAQVQGRSVTYLAKQLFEWVSTNRERTSQLKSLLTAMVENHKPLIPYLAYYYCTSNLNLTDLEIEKDLIVSLQEVKERYDKEINILEKKVAELERNLQGRFWQEYKEEKIRKRIENVESKQEILYQFEIIKRENIILERICRLHSRIFYYVDSEDRWKSLKLDMKGIMSKYQVKQFNSPDEIVPYNPDEYELIEGTHGKIVRIIIPAYFRIIEGRRILVRKGAAELIE